MTSRAAQKVLSQVINVIEKEMSYATGVYGRGLANEGYAGGYRDALNQVCLLLNDVEPQGRYWDQLT